MSGSRKAWCAVYAILVVLALVGTWGNNIQYGHLGALEANVRFWSDTLVNPASRSITVDVFFLTAAVVIWMVQEARRLSMRGVWWYVLFGVLVAISAAVPAFMIHREMAMARQGESVSTMKRSDLIGVGLMIAGSIFYGFWTLTH